MTTEQWAHFSNYAMGSAYMVLFLALFAHVIEILLARQAVKRSSLESVAAGGSLVESPAAEDDVAGAPDRWSGMGVSLTALGTLLLIGASVTRGIATARAPFGNMYEFGMTGTAIALAVYLVLVWRWQIQWLAATVLAISLVVLTLSISTYVPAGPLVPALNTYWKWIHVGSIMTAAAMFLVGAAASVLFLVKDRSEATGRTSGFLVRFPESAKIDQIAFRANAIGFPLWTFGALIAGPIWAHLAWGRYWGWDPKEVWALITWAVYAGYLHARVTAGWKGRRAAVIGLVGFGTFIMSYYIVNLFAAGMHSYGK
jgi:cytochrome c-type biogenesis protein CcsB